MIMIRLVCDGEHDPDIEVANLVMGENQYTAYIAQMYEYFKFEMDIILPTGWSFRLVGNDPVEPQRRKLFCPKCLTNKFESDYLANKDDAHEAMVPPENETV